MRALLMPDTAPAASRSQSESGRQQSHGRPEWHSAPGEHCPDTEGRVWTQGSWVPILTGTGCHVLFGKRHNIHGWSEPNALPEWLYTAAVLDSFLRRLEVQSIPVEHSQSPRIMRLIRRYPSRTTHVIMTAASEIRTVQRITIISRSAFVIIVFLLHIGGRKSGNL
jgi:hypothetical protein